MYEFALGLFGVQIDFIGLPRRIDYCGPSIGCIQPLVLDIKFKFSSIITPTDLITSTLLNWVPLISKVGEIGRFFSFCID